MTEVKKKNTTTKAKTETTAKKTTAANAKKATTTKKSTTSTQSKKTKTTETKLVLRDVKEVLNDRKVVEEKLTQAEISYNKVNYKYVTLKNELRSTEKIINRTSDDGLIKLHKKEDKLKEKVSKTESKLDKLIEKKDTLEKNEYKSKLFAQKQELKKLNKELKEQSKKVHKYENTPMDTYVKKADEINKKIDAITPELDKKKEKVSKYKKKYKELNKEWSALFPDEDDSVAISVKNLDIFYGKKQAIFDVTMDLPKNQVIAIIGPSGCGKSTFLKTLNRINDEIPSFRAEGDILLQNEINVLTLENVHDSSHKITLPELRTKVGMVFQQPNPFPMSIYNNVAYGPKINGIKNKSVLKEIVINSLKSAAIYEQVKDNLNALATGLSGGQQQRLCIARAIANRPDVLLMDEPTSALDPIAAKKVEDLILELKKYYTIIMVTHSMQQAKRISDYTAFFYQGELIEYGETEQIFNKPKDKKTNDYINGKFG